MPQFRSLYGKCVNEDREFNRISVRMLTDRMLREKHPICLLNELGCGFQFHDGARSGPDHLPVFRSYVTVADMTFEGWGHSKRDARASAARACLAALLARAGRVLPPAQPLHHDFTSDEPARRPVSETVRLDPVRKPMLPLMSYQLKKEPPKPPSPSETSPSGSSIWGSATAPTILKSPINRLYENYPGLTFTCTFGDGSDLTSNQAAPQQLSHSMRFKVICQIKDQKFEGYGSSKKLAKLAAARSALAVLEEGSAEPAPVASTNTSGFLPQTLADHVAKLVNEKFNEVMKNDVAHSKRKVLAGIVITINNKTEGAKVVAVTTGTKCVSGEHMSVRGRAVNDSHAEVAARRCLQRHLYAQLLRYANSKNPRQPIPDSDIEPLPAGGYQLKPDRQVHLYVSTAPCGDGRIFSPHEQPDHEPDRHPNRLARGQLRTKIESGEGTIPVKNCSNVLQTWDGVLQGERLLTMSCSDKVARWCVVGLQGGLLSRFMRPVYLTSLVLGSLLHPDHMYRALCGRIECTIAPLPPPFRLQRPLLARAASAEARNAARAPSFSVCWANTAPLPEVVNATTGKLENGQPSLLCKQSMFARWQHLVNKIPHLPQESDLDTELPKMPASLENLLYNEAKLLCPSYQIAKTHLIEAFDKAKLGKWIKKPIEQDQFICEITDADPTALFAWAGRAVHRTTVQGGRDGLSEARRRAEARDEARDVKDVTQLGEEKNDNEICKELVLRPRVVDYDSDLSVDEEETTGLKAICDADDTEALETKFRAICDVDSEAKATWSERAKRHMDKIYEQIFGKVHEKEGSLNGDEIIKTREELKRVQVLKNLRLNATNGDDKDVDDERDERSDREVTVLTKRQDLVKYGARACQMMELRRASSRSEKDLSEDMAKDEVESDENFKMNKAESRNKDVYRQTLQCRLINRRNSLIFDVQKSHENSFDKTKELCYIKGTDNLKQDKALNIQREPEVFKKKDFNRQNIQDRLINRRNNQIFIGDKNNNSIDNNRNMNNKNTTVSHGRGTDNFEKPKDEFARRSSVQDRLVNRNKDQILDDETKRKLYDFNTKDRRNNEKKRFGEDDKTEMPFYNAKNIPDEKNNRFSADDNKGEPNEDKRCQDELKTAIYLRKELIKKRLFEGLRKEAKRNPSFDDNNDIDECKHEFNTQKPKFSDIHVLPDKLISRKSSQNFASYGKENINTEFFNNVKEFQEKDAPKRLSIQDRLINEGYYQKVLPSPIKLTGLGKTSSNVKEDFGKEIASFKKVTETTQSTGRNEREDIRQKILSSGYYQHARSQLRSDCKGSNLPRIREESKTDFDHTDSRPDLTKTHEFDDTKFTRPTEFETDSLTSFIY